MSNNRLHRPSGWPGRAPGRCRAGLPLEARLIPAEGGGAMRAGSAVRHCGGGHEFRRTVIIHNTDITQSNMECLMNRSDMVGGQRKVGRKSTITALLCLTLCRLTNVCCLGPLAGTWLPAPPHPPLLRPPGGSEVMGVAAHNKDHDCRDQEMKAAHAPMPTTLASDKLNETPRDARWLTHLINSHMH